MDPRASTPVLLLLTAALAGCIGALSPASLPTDTSDVEDLTPDLVDDLLTVKHEHSNASTHAVASGVAEVAYHKLLEDRDPGSCGYLETTVQEDHAYQVVTCGSRSGFVIVDISDPSTAEPVSKYMTDTPYVWDVKVSDDGEVAFIGIQGTPGLSYDPMVKPERGGVPTSGVVAVDISDKEDPRFLARIPVPNGGHNVAYEEVDGRDVVMVTVNNFVASAAGVAPSPVHAEDPVQTRVQLLEFHRSGTGGPSFEPLSSYRYVPDQPVRYKGEGTWYHQAHFPHDMYAADHPKTGQDLMYVAYWDAGVRIVDISDPSDPAEIGSWTGFDVPSSGNIHYVQPFPETIDGKHYTTASPEFAPHDDTGLVRILDTTDPEDPTVVGTWTYPKDVISGRDDPGFTTFSAHNADVANGRIYQAAYHGGLWILDVTDRGTPEDPEAVGVYAPVPPEDVRDDIDARTPNVWGTAVKGDHVLMGDIGTGMYTVRDLTAPR